MTGTELIDFIRTNNLENETLEVTYFSWLRKQKLCGDCKQIIPLDKFHKGTSGAEPEKSSHYRYICKDCLNKAAFHKKYKRTNYKRFNVR